MSLRFIDRNADTPERIRRNFQRLRNGAGTSSVTAAAPITNTSTGIGLAFAANTGLALVANALALLFADGTITGSASGIKVSSTVVINTRAVNTTAPLAGGGTLASDLTLSIPQATAAANGYLSSTDWTTFNAKQPAGSYLAGSTALATTAPLTGGGNLSTGLTLGIPQATTVSGGYLSSTDWNTFSNKQVAGNYTSTGRIINTTAPLAGGGNLTADLTLSMPPATSTANGYLTSTNWTTFNNKQPAGSYLTSVAATDTGIVVTSGSTIAVGLAALGGLQVSSGLLVRGFRTPAATPGSLANGDNWYNTTTDITGIQVKGLTAQLPVVLVADGGGTPVVSTTAFTALNTTVTLPANFWQAKRTIRVKFWGNYVASGSSPTLVLGAFVDSANTLGDGPTISLGTSGLGRFYFEVTFTCLTTGSVNTIRSGGYGYCEVSGVVQLFVLGTTISANTASSMIVEAVAKWSAASASNSVTGQGCEISMIG